MIAHILYYLYLLCVSQIQNANTVSSRDNDPTDLFPIVQPSRIQCAVND